MVTSRKGVRQWLEAAVLAAGREELMGNKDKGGKHVKTAPAKTLKEKRAEKRSKKGAGA